MPSKSRGSKDGGSKSNVSNLDASDSTKKHKLDACDSSVLGKPEQMSEVNLLLKAKALKLLKESQNEKKANKKKDQKKTDAKAEKAKKVKKDREPKSKKKS